MYDCVFRLSEQPNNSITTMKGMLRLQVLIIIVPKYMITNVDQSARLHVSFIMATLYSKYKHHDSNWKQNDNLRVDIVWIAKWMDKNPTTCCSSLTCMNIGLLKENMNWMIMDKWQWRLIVPVILVCTYKWNEMVSIRIVEVQLLNYCIGDWLIRSCLHVNLNKIAKWWKVNVIDTKR